MSLLHLLLPTVCMYLLKFPDVSDVTPIVALAFWYPRRLCNFFVSESAFRHGKHYGTDQSET